MNDAIASIAPRVRAGELPFEQVARNPNISEAERAKEAARQFEAVLLRQILQTAHKTGIEGLTGESSGSKDIYFDMMNYHLADTISKAGGLGLASALEAQLLQQSPAPAPDEHEPAH
jgi:peptidoglycan hydrolase FlgJ